MSTYDRSIRQTLRTALRRICGQRDSEPEPPERTAVGPTDPAAGQPARHLQRQARRRLRAAAVALAAGARRRPAAAQMRRPPPAPHRTAFTCPPSSGPSRHGLRPPKLEQAVAVLATDTEEASMHTNWALTPAPRRPMTCAFHPAQYLIGNEPTRTVPADMIWYLRLNDGKVHAIEVGGYPGRRRRYQRSVLPRHRQRGDLWLTTCSPPWDWRPRPSSAA